MFSVFLELVKRVGIFVIIGQTIMHFGISKKYEKYMKLAISLMVAAQIIFTFDIYFEKDASSWQRMSREEYRQAWDENMREVEERMEKSRVEMTLRMEEKFCQSGTNVTKGMEIQKQGIRVEKIKIP